MKAHRLLPPALVAVLAAAVAAAASPPAEGPEWMSSLKKAFEASKTRGAPILVWCVGDADSAEKEDHKVFTDPKVRDAMRGYLVVFANPVDDHGSQDGTLDGKPGKVCRLAPAIACSDHMRSWTEVYGSYADVIADKSGNVKVPCHFVVGPDGKTVGTINSGTVAAGFNAVPAGQMIKSLGTLLVKAGGPGLTAEALDAARKRVVSARNSVEAGRLSEAALALQPVIAIGKGIEVVNDARELLKRVDRKAAEVFAKGKSEIAAGNALAGLTSLQRVVDEFPGTESAEQARAAADEFRASPAGKKALADIKREEKGRVELKKAAALADAGGKDVEALRLLDGIARTYAGLPCGEEAAAKAAAIRGDPARMGAVEKERTEREAKAALVAARGLLDGGKIPEGQARLRKLVADFPGTAAAAEAQRLLESVR